MEPLSQREKGLVAVSVALLVALIVVIVMYNKDSFSHGPIPFSTRHRVEMDRQRRFDEQMRGESGSLYFHHNQELVGHSHM
jgi:hypothetical protein